MHRIRRSRKTTPLNTSSTDRRATPYQCSHPCLPCGGYDRACLARRSTNCAAKEVIVVDDGSPDETASVAESVRTELGETILKIFRQDNLYAGAARNRAVREATSDYLAFLDADDEWLPEKLERFGVLRSRNLGLVAHNHIAVNTDGTTALVECAASFRTALIRS